jgi:hypothetical protein
MFIILLAQQANWRTNVTEAGAWEDSSRLGTQDFPASSKYWFLSWARWIHSILLVYDSENRHNMSIVGSPIGSCFLL